MATQVDTAQREIVLVEDAHIRPMMGNQVLESLPSRHIPYSLVDPFILVHEADLKIDPNQESQDTTHPHRGFDNLWYAISGSSSTGHSTGPGGDFERARLDEGSLLFIRTGRGVLHAEGDATIRVLVGEGSPIELGTPGLILDVQLPKGGKASLAVQAGFNGFVHMLEGEAGFGANQLPAKRGQIAVLGPGDALAVEDAQPGTRFVLMAGKPYGERPIYNGPYVD